MKMWKFNEGSFENVYDADYHRMKFDASKIHNGGKKSIMAAKKHEFLVKFPSKSYLTGTRNVQNTLKVYQHTI